MTRLAILSLLLLPFLTLAQPPIDPCQAFRRLIAEAEAELQKTNLDPEYIFKKLRSARVMARDCDAGQDEIVDRKYQALYQKLEAQKNAAILSQRRAEKAEAEAQQLAETAEARSRANYNAVQALKVARRDPTLALRMADYNYQHHPEEPAAATALHKILSDTPQGHYQQTFSGHQDNVKAVAFSPDGQFVLTGSAGDTAKLWNLQGQEIQSFTGHRSYVSAVAFSPDGQFVLTGSPDNTAKLWNLKGQEIQSFTGHRSYVSAVAFSPDGQFVLTGSGDHTAKLWLPYLSYLQKRVARIAFPELVEGGLLVDDPTLQHFRDTATTAALKEIAGLLFERRDWEKAKSFYEKVHQMDPTAVDALFGLYQIAQETGESFDFDRFLSLRSLAALEHARQFFTQQRAADYESSRQNYWNATRIGERLLEVDSTVAARVQVTNDYNSLGWHQLLTGAFAEAEQSIRRGIELDASNQYLYTNLPPALLFQGQYEAAMAEYKKWMDRSFDQASNFATFREAFLDDFNTFEEAGIIPEAQRAAVEQVKAMLQGEEMKPKNR